MLNLSAIVADMAPLSGRVKVSKYPVTGHRSNQAGGHAIPPDRQEAQWLKNGCQSL